MNITMGGRAKRTNLKTRYLASIVSGVLAFSVLAGLSGALTDDVTPRMTTQPQVVSAGNASSFESSADYEAREAAALTALKDLRTANASAE